MTTRPTPPRRPTGPVRRTDGPARTAVRRSPVRPAAGATPDRLGLTTRAAVLGLVLCAVVLSAAVPLREFLAQRGDIGRAREAQVGQRARIAALEVQQQQLQDPEYVKRQARERFGMVLPGETVYTVLRPGAAAPSAGRPGEAAPALDSGPWYARLWSSIRAADRVPAPDDTAPGGPGPGDQAPAGR